ncbi:vWA domain-containing protein [Streptomyces sp. 8N706]|uniref:vWA domain-containing protein n=1 Tax=Streptomyces sp. 8N706 TaxID=3457416 RepID=UPI003FD22FF5
MTATLSLILSEGPVPRGQLGPVKPTSPNVAVVYATASGELGSTGGRPLTWSQHFFTKYRTRYEVDLSDHRRKARLQSSPLTCSDQAHRFEATIDVGFRVTDPEALVRRNVRDALVVVYGHLTHQLRSHARNFAIDEAARAEAYINRACAAQTPLPEGITIYHCTVELEPDAAAREYIRTLEQARRERTVGQDRFDADVATTRAEEYLNDIRHEAGLKRDDERRRALAGVSLDLEGLIRQHLTQHPEDTSHALELMTRWEEARVGRAELQDQRQVEMFRFLVDKDIIRQADLPRIRDGVLGQLPGAPASVAALPAGPPSPQQTAPQPPAHTSPPVVWGGSAAAPAGPAGTAAPAGTAGTAAPAGTTGTAAPAGTGVIPVYAVIDESRAAAGCIEELNNGLRSLHSVLANSPDVQPVVRLSVLGYAERTEVRMPLARVGWGTDVPVLSTGAGAAYAPVFRKLLELLPDDVGRLKKQGGQVHRPVVFFLTTGVPEDGTEWTASLDLLKGHRYAPTVVACGIAEADRGTVLRIAGRPELAYVAAPQTDAGSAATQFSMLLQNTVLHLGRGVVAGSADLAVACPQGLRRADTAL